MMKLALVVLFVCGVSSVLADDGGAKCNPTDFKAAQDNFTSILQIPASEDWKDPLTLWQALHDFFGRDSKLGLVRVCNAFNVLIDGLNKKGIDVKTCFDPLFILGNEAIPDNGLRFLGVIGALRFQCGAGLYPIMENNKWPCASKVFANSGTKMVQALTAVLTNTEIDRVNRCQIVKDGELTYYKPLHDACSDAATTYFGCQTFNQFFNTMYAECSNECKLLA